MARRLAYSNNNLASRLSKRCAGCGDDKDVTYHDQTGLYTCPACDPMKVRRDIANDGTNLTD